MAMAWKSPVEMLVFSFSPFSIFWYFMALGGHRGGPRTNEMSLYRALGMPEAKIVFAWKDR